MKKFILIIAFIVGLNADSLNDKIEELVGSDQYNKHKNFINSIFANKARFVNNGELNIAQILQELKNNGLLVLKFDKPLELEVNFISVANPSILTYTTSDILSSMGYSYFMVKKAGFSKKTTSVKYSLKTEHALDPVIFMNELNKRGFRLYDVKRISINEWEYRIQVLSPKLLNAKKLESNQMLNLREVSGEYWLSVKTNNNLYINANNKWTPRVVCFDENLKIVKLIVNDKPSQNLKVSLDKNIAFVFISDANNPEVIKNSLEVKLD